jgi:hypothetical protein
MPFKNFSDFRQRSGTELLPTDFLVGYRDQVAEYRTTISDLNIELLKNLNLQAAPEVLFVTPGGKDTNTGRSEFNSLRTIKRACAKALEISRAGANLALEQALGNIYNNGVPIWGIGSKQVNIFVRTGDYIEDNPIYLPPSCTIIGDNLRSVSIIPKNKFYDIIWVNNRCYVWGVTFRTHKNPSYAIAYPELRYINGVNVESYSNTRTQTATAKALDFYTRLPDIYPVTTTANENLLNLSQDLPVGEKLFDPAKIAFLRRYFLNLNTSFFNTDEIDLDNNFDTTTFYNNEIRKPYQITSPYTQGCSSITTPTSAGADDAGGGLLVDGYKVDGPLRSMVMDSFTQFNEGGKGVHIINNGYAQLVSTFTICCTQGVIAESGGTCSINTSNCSFGNQGLVAYGKSPRPTLIGFLGDDITSLTDNVFVRGIRGVDSQSFLEWEPAFRNDFQPYPGQVFEIIVQSAGNVNINNSGQLFTVLSAQKAEIDFSPGGGYTCNLVLDTNYSPALDTSNTLSSKIIPAGSIVKFYIRSTITTSAHTMEYIGTGTNLLSAVPQKGGQTDVSKEVVFDDVGRVFFTATNQFGDFRIGNDLTIVQATGTIEGETFSRSILQTTTPIAIALTS